MQFDVPYVDGNGNNVPKTVAPKEDDMQVLQTSDYDNLHEVRRIGFGYFLDDHEGMPDL